MTGAPCIYTIPSGFSFVDILAKGILEEAGPDPLALAKVHILLPTRRACRSLREAFLKIGNGAPRLLPRMNPIGDVDEEELSFSFSGAEQELAVPPSLSPLRRQFLLTRLIAAQGLTRGLEQDMALAAALGRLMDQVYTQNLDLKNLPDAIDNKEFSEHWQISLEFLQLLSVHWPLILAEQGVIDAADRRNRLLNSLSDYWEAHPPQHRIIAAGSTGSIPSTARLLKTISALPNGCIVLPGLDQVMDEESWAAIDDTHPQATLRNLLSELEQKRMDVAIWPAATKLSDEGKLLRHLTSEIMRPADTTREWQTVKERIDFSPEDLPIERYDCATPQEEALTIALALRGVLEEPGKVGALVTPDRKLARRVAMACRRWGIEIDDSAGLNLPDTRVGAYLRLLMEAVLKDVKPVSLMAFCKHGLCRPKRQENWRSAIARLDATIMRGTAYDGGFRAYEVKIAERAEKNKDIDGLADTLSFIEAGLEQLCRLNDGTARPFREWCEAHLRAAEYFCDPEILWSHEDGEAAASLFPDLIEQAELLPDMNARDYLTVVETAMKAVTARPSFGLHPRLMILGQLEARLLGADIMILAGLNEGTWPPKPSTDPWMSRPMRRKFGLPPLERSIGLSAHDFAQALGSEKIIVTRSMRVDGAPTVPSRWLQRLETVLQAAGHAPDSLSHGPLLEQARLLDHTDIYKPVERPAPTPPVSARPRKLSVTKIDTWLGDPYSIYARYVLGLEPLDPLEKPFDAAERGTLLHTVLDRFVEACPAELSAEALDIFMTIAAEELSKLPIGDDVRAAWLPRLQKTARWLVRHEHEWRTRFLPSGREVYGRMEFQGPAGTFTLSGVADRIDLSRDGTAAAIIDYKSGGTFSLSGMQDGKYPQLPLEALMLEAGAFGDAPEGGTAALAYWVLNGSGEGGCCTCLTDDSRNAKISVAKDNARAGLQALIDAFDREDTPYYSLPRPDRAPRFNDYRHLSRVLEWTALDDAENEDAA